MFTLQQAYEALDGHDEFVVKSYDDLICIDYIIALQFSFFPSEEEIVKRMQYLCKKAGDADGNFVQYRLQAEKDCERHAEIRRNFRGIIFDATTGELLSLPLHKFFNVNQIASTQFDLLKNCQASIYEKLDGSMIHFFLQKGKLRAATCRSTETPQAQAALALAKKSGLESKIIDVIKSGYTPIFEYVAANNQIVVFYNKARLVYLISRHRKTGDYVFDESFEDKASFYSFNFADVHEKIDREDFEGYVCHLDNGMMVKVKTPWYIERHHAVDALMRPKYKLYKIVFEGVMDDLIAIAADRYKPDLAQIFEEAQRDLLNEKIRVEKQFEDLKVELNKKTFEVPKNKLEEFRDKLNRHILNKKLQVKRLRIRRFEDPLSIRRFEGSLIKKNYVFNELAELENQFYFNELEKKVKASFTQLVRERYPDDFHLMMAVYSDYLYGTDSLTELAQRKLMEIYKIKYPNKLYADLDVEMEG